MIVTVMQIRIMRMGMNHRRMTMPVRVRFAGGIARAMPVLVM